MKKTLREALEGEKLVVAPTGNLVRLSQEKATMEMFYVSMRNWYEEWDRTNSLTEEQQKDCLLPKKAWRALTACAIDASRAEGEAEEMIRDVKRRITKWRVLVENALISDDWTDVDGELTLLELSGDVQLEADE